MSKTLENIFIGMGPVILVSRVFLRYHSVSQILAGMVIGTMVSIVFFLTYGRKIEEGKATGTILDRLIKEIAKEERKEDRKEEAGKRKGK